MHWQLSTTNDFHVRNSIYISKHPTEMRADLLLEYSKQDEEVWCRVPYTEKRHSDLDTICKRISEKFESPGLIGVLYYYDVLGNPHSVFQGTRLASGLKASHNLGVFFLSLPAWRKNYKYSQFMLCIEDLIAEMEKTYGDAWLIEVNKRSDSIYVKLGFNDGAKVDSALFDPLRTLDGNNAKFLCDCGQFRNMAHFKSKCDFTLGANGYVGLGFYYNSVKLGCCDYVSLGDGRFFQNMGYVDRGYVAYKHSGYSYYVRARNIDEKKVVVRPRLGHSDDDIYVPVNAFHSIEEFALERSLAGGLRPGDACYLYCEVVDPEGESRSVSDIACWDGSKWIDYYKETEIENWPALQAGWRKDDQNN